MPVGAGRTCRIFFVPYCFRHCLRHCRAHLSLRGLGHRLLEVSLEPVSAPNWVRGQETWLVQNCCFAGRDDCGRAISILRETNGRWVEFEETTTLLNAASKGLGGRRWPVRYFGDKPRDTQAVPLDFRSQRAPLLEMT